MSDIQDVDVPAPSAATPRGPRTALPLPVLPQREEVPFASNIWMRLSFASGWVSL